MIELWKPAFGFESKYEVSTKGRVRIIGRDQLGRSRYIGRILSPSLCRGYIKYLLHKGDGSRKNVLAHILVAETFIGPRPDGMIVNHKNGNKTDPSIDNLEYVTPYENHMHALKNGLYVPPSGSSHWSARLTDDDVLQIYKSVGKGESQENIAKRYGCSQVTVSNISRGVGRVAALLCQ